MPATSIFSARASPYGTNGGRVFAYRRNGTTWQAAGRLDVSQNDGTFGMNVTVIADTVVVGTPVGNVSTFQQGRAYVFTPATANTWNPGVPLQATNDGNIQQLREFGDSVAISDATLVVGAPGSINQNVRKGAAVVFRRDTAMRWTQKSGPLVDEFAHADDRFGGAVSILGDWNAVGSSRGDAGNLPDTGLVHVFRRVNGLWSVQTSQLRPERALPEALGSDIAMGNGIVVGAAPNATNFSGRVIGTGRLYTFAPNPAS